MYLIYSQVNGLRLLRIKIATYSSIIVLLVIVGVFSIQVSAVVPVLMCMLIVILIGSVSVVEKVRCVVYIIDYEYLIGILCGQCGNGEGVSALLNNCVTCSNNNIVLIPLLGTV